MAVKGKMFVCQHCEKEFFVPQYDINSRPTIKYCSRDCYHLASRKPPRLQTCLHCGKEFAFSSKHKGKMFCNVNCACAYKRGRERVATLDAKGYKNVWFADGSGEKEHRYIIEQMIGRKLGRDEVVHHIDGNRANNEISNLAVMTRGEHSSLHRRMELETGKRLFGGDEHSNQLTSQRCEI